jgi:hypothetical protein
MTMDRASGGATPFTITAGPTPAGDDIVTGTTAGKLNAGGWTNETDAFTLWIYGSLASDRIYVILSPIPYIATHALNISAWWTSQGAPVPALVTPETRPWIYCTFGNSGGAPTFSTNSSPFISTSNLASWVRPSITNGVYAFDNADVAITPFSTSTALQRGFYHTFFWRSIVGNLELFTSTSSQVLNVGSTVRAVQTWTRVPFDESYYGTEAPRVADTLYMLLPVGSKFPVAVWSSTDAAWDLMEFYSGAFYDTDVDLNRTYGIARYFDTGYPFFAAGGGTGTGDYDTFVPTNTSQNGSSFTTSDITTTNRVVADVGLMDIDAGNFDRNLNDIALPQLISYGRFDTWPTPTAATPPTGPAWIRATFNAVKTNMLTVVDYYEGDLPAPGGIFEDTWTDVYMFADLSQGKIYEVADLNTTNAGFRAIFWSNGYQSTEVKSDALNTSGDGQVATINDNKSIINMNTSPVAGYPPIASSNGYSTRFLTNTSDVRLGWTTDALEPESSYVSFVGEYAARNGSYVVLRPIYEPSSGTGWYECDYTVASGVLTVQSVVDDTTDPTTGAGVDLTKLYIYGNRSTGFIVDMIVRPSSDVTSMNLLVWGTPSSDKVGQARTLFKHAGTFVWRNTRPYWWRESGLDNTTTTLPATPGTWKTSGVFDPFGTIDVSENDMSLFSVATYMEQAAGEYILPEYSSSTSGISSSTSEVQPQQ